MLGPQLRIDRRRLGYRKGGLLEAQRDELPTHERTAPFEG